MSNQRITNLDFIRGISVLGILVMNSIMFFLPDAAYWNHSSIGADHAIDWILVVFSEVFIAEKMMGLFSLLFGASVVLFIESARNRNHGRPRWLSFWRNLLLLGFGLLHLQLWHGDILLVYAIAAVFVILLHNRSFKLLISLSGLLFLVPILASFLFQGAFDAQGNLTEGFKESFPDISGGLGGYWFSNVNEMGDLAGIFVAIDAVCRALSLMLLGVVLYRSSVLQGNLDSRVYKKMAGIGLLVGLPLSIASIVWLIAEEYKPDIALIGFVPGALGVIPLVLAYVGLLSLWNKSISSKLALYIRACGRMAFTNYITQTILGVVLFGLIFEKGDLSRKEIILFVLFVWVIQLLWSKHWLDRFKYGPLEWVWRKLTYVQISKLSETSDKSSG